MVGEIHAHLLEYVALAIERPDTYLVRGVTRGMPLVDSVSVSGVPLARSTMASIPLADLSADLPSRDAEILRRLQSSSDRALDDACWRATLRDVERGWLSEL